jgi:hypothetical protein
MLPHPPDERGSARDGRAAPAPLRRPVSHSIDAPTPTDTVRAVTRTSVVPESSDTPAATSPPSAVAPSTNERGGRHASRGHARASRLTPSPFVGTKEAVAGLALSSVGWILWSLPAFRNPETLDLGLAYSAGQVAWTNGHPETVYSWDGTSFLALLMALTTRVFSAVTTANILTVINVALLIAMVVIIWWRMRTAIGRWYWWGSLAAASVFGPAVSTIGWKQFNLAGLAFAAGGFWILQKRRSDWQWLLLGSFLIAFSISVKPVALLVVLGLLIRRDSRPAGILSAIWIVVLEVVAVAFMALRSHSWHSLSPFVSYGNFSTKTAPANLWVCNPENFSPQSILCRMGNPSHYWTVQHVAVIAGLLLLLALASTSIRGDSGFSWRLFAYSCAFSPMVSPLAWSHYQVMLGPLFVVLVFDFAHRRPAIAVWLSVLSAYVLCELVWRPYGTLPGVIVHFVNGRVETLASEYTVFAWATFAQYILVAVAIVYYAALTKGVLAGSDSPPVDLLLGESGDSSAPE